MAKFENKLDWSIYNI